jgi:hypothetical protein
MKTSTQRLSGIGGCTTALALLALLAGAVAAVAQSYQHGNSTTIIEQSGGSTNSESQVRQYPDGQTIITENGNSTDITIQRESGPSGFGNNGELPQDYFRQRVDERFSRSHADGADDTDR